MVFHSAFSHWRDFHYRYDIWATIWNIRIWNLARTNGTLKRLRSKRSVSVCHMVYRLRKGNLLFRRLDSNLVKWGGDDDETSEHSRHSLHNVQSILVKETRDDGNNIRTHKRGELSPCNTDNSVSFELSCLLQLVGCDHRLEILISLLKRELISLLHNLIEWIGAVGKASVLKYLRR